MTSLSLRVIFHLPLRKTEGFVASLIGLMGLSLKTPDHTTLSRRNRDVEVPRLPRGQDGPLHLVIDSTGLKIFGEGEWQVHKHKSSKKRRSWRKLHLGIDGDGCIIASALTDSSSDDAYVGLSILEQIEGTITQFTADGAYDTRPMYEALAASGAADIRIVIHRRRRSPWTGEPRDPGANATRPSRGSARSVDVSGGRSRVPTARLTRRTGCPGTSASPGIVSEPGIARPRGRRR